MIQWSLSGHQHVCISYNKKQHKKTSNGRRSQLDQYWPYRPHSNFKPTWFFLWFCVFPSSDTFDKNKKYRCWYWGSKVNTGSLLRIKQTKVIPKYMEVVPHSQPTAPQQTVCKFHLDPQNNLFHWGYTSWGVSTPCNSGWLSTMPIFERNKYAPLDHLGLAICLLLH